MGRSCLLSWCKSSQQKTPHKTFHCFPKQAALCKKWCDALMLANKIPGTATICSDHFDDSDIAHGTRTVLCPGAIPKLPSETHIVELRIGATSTSKIVMIDGKTVLRIKFLVSTEESVSNENVAIALKIENKANEPDPTIPCKNPKSESKSTASCAHLRPAINSSYPRKKFNHRFTRMLVTARRAHKICAKSRLCWKKLYQSRNKEYLQKCRDLKLLQQNMRKESTKIHKLYQQRFGKFLSPNQIRKVIGGKNVKWTNADIAESIAIKYSNNTYEEMRKRNYPLPAPRTLRKHAAKVICIPGLQKQVLDLVKYQFKSVKDIVRECVVCFDEISINPALEYDPESDRVYGNKTNLQVVMIRGLYYDWQQVVSFDFNQKFTADTFQEILDAVHSAGLVIRAIVSDMGSKNVGLFKSFKVGVNVTEEAVTVTNTIKSRSVDNHNIYVFADAPHLLKAIRNNILNHGLMLEQGHVITKADFEELIRVERDSELKESFKLTNDHLNMTSRQRMRVFLAAQLLSRTVAAHWRKVFPRRIFEAEFIETVSDWWDAMNSRHVFEKIPIKQPFGLHSIHLQAVQKMQRTISKVKVLKKGGFHNYLFPFQKGLLLSTKSIQDLFNDARNSHLAINYILTSRVNQDILESFFASLRSVGGFNINPTALDAIRRMKILMFSKCKSISKSTNVAIPGDDVTPIPSLTAGMLEALKKSCKPPQVTDTNERLCMEPIEIDNATLESLLQPEEWNLQKQCHESAVEYLAGYLASKYYLKCPYTLADPRELAKLEDVSWVKKLRKDHLKVPSIQFRNEIKTLDAEFVKFHQDDQNLFSGGVLSGFSNALSYKYRHIPSAIIKSFMNSRLRIHMKFINSSRIEKQEKAKQHAESRNLAIRNAFKNKHLVEVLSSGSNVTRTQEFSSDRDDINLMSLYNNEEFFWSDDVKRHASLIIGTRSLKPLQKASINATLTGVDVLLVLGTGSGKSLVYQVASQVASGVTIVVSPLNSLVQNQVNELLSLKINSASFNIVDGRTHEIEQYDTILDPSSSVKILFITPEKVHNSSVFRTFLKNLFTSGRLSRFVVDEMHCLLDWGFTFRASYRFLGTLRSEYPSVPFLGLTATATDKELEEIKVLLNLPNAVIFKEPLVRPNLAYRTIFTDQSHKDDLLIKMIKEMDNLSGIVYCQTRKECEQISKRIVSIGVSSHHYHADLAINVRKLVLEKWMSGECKVVVATVAFGMGINKPDCRLVFHYVIPKSMNNFVQETGRAGRDGCVSNCVLFATNNDIFKILGTAAVDVRESNFTPLIEYILDSVTCRNELIAAYYGQKVNKIAGCYCEVCAGSETASTVCVNDTLRSIIDILKLAESVDVNLTSRMINNILIGKSRDKLFVSFSKSSNLDTLIVDKVLLKALHLGVIQVYYDPLPTRTISYIRLGMHAHVFESGSGNVYVNV